MGEGVSVDGAKERLKGFDSIEVVQGATYKDCSTILIVPTRGKPWEPTLSAKFYYALSNLIAPMNQHRALSFACGHEVGAAYDAALKVILETPSYARCKYVLTVEDDNLPPPDGHLRLLESIDETGWDVMAGLYFTKGLLNEPMAFGDPDEFRRTGVLGFEPRDVREAVKKGQLMEVNGVAMGFTLWRMDVFRDVAPPWFVTCPEVGRDGLPAASFAAGDGHRIGMTQDLAYCFPAGAWVYGKRVQRIEKLRVGSQVISHTGAMHKVVDPMSRRYSGRMVRVVPMYGAPVVATPEHPFLARIPVRAPSLIIAVGADGRPLERRAEKAGWMKAAHWVEAGSLKTGDWLFVPKARTRRYKTRARWPLQWYINLRDLHRGADGLIGYERTRKSALRIADHIELTPGFCRLLGYYIAEGSTGGNLQPGRSSRRQTLTFHFGHHEPDLVDDCVRLLRESFPGVEPKVIPMPERGVTNVQVCSRILARLFAALGGKGAHRKRLPRHWFSLSDDCLGELIRGYWLGDGSVVGGRDFSFTTVSERLAHEVRCALLRLNILAAIREGVTDAGGPRFQVEIPHPLAKRFARVVGQPEPDVRERVKWLKETKNHFLVRVKHVEEFVFEGDVYNAEVATSHTFNVNGFAVHNCVRARRAGKRFGVDCRVKVAHFDAVNEEVY